MRSPLALPLVALLSAGCNNPSSKPSESVGSAVALPAAASGASAAGSTSSDAPPGGKDEKGEPKAAAAHGPLNVLLLSVDCLRQDMPWAGYARPIAPNLTKLAAESVVYTHAYSVSSYTAKSVAAMMTSRYPSSLYRSGYFFADYSKANVFLAEILHDHGVRTMGVHAHLYFGRGKQLDQGFDVWELVPGITFDAETDKNVTSDKMTDLGIKLLGAPENTSKPFFAWLHYTDPHDEYVKHKESPDFGKSNRDRYDSEVFFADLHIGRLLDWAKTQPWWNNTAVILTADHGEAFGEHKLYKHAFWLWEILTRVPLFVHAPGLAPKRIHQNRSHIDLAPTVLDLMGIKDLPASFVGHSLLPEMEGRKPPDDRDPIVLDLPEDTHNPQVRAVIQGQKKIIMYGKGRPELYDLSADPGELSDLSKSSPEVFAEMKKLYDRTWATIPIVAPYGGMKLREGGTAKGPMAP